MQVVDLVREARRAASLAQHGRAAVQWLQALQVLHGTTFVLIISHNMQLAPASLALQAEVEVEFCASMRAFCEQLCERGQSEQVRWLSAQTAAVLIQTPEIYFMVW